MWSHLARTRDTVTKQNETIHIGERGSESSQEEPIEMLRKTVRSVQKAPNTSSSSTLHVSLEYPASGEK